ncbi:MAG: tetratricopeptide repeat-containing protein kinase family protein [Planctomycetota bacterium]
MVGDEIGGLRSALLGGAPDIPGYRVLGLLGRGGWGRVYEATEVLTARRVAIKVISVRSPEVWRRVVGEIRALTVIESAGVVGLLTWGRVGNEVYLVMRLVRGGRRLDVAARALSPLARLRLLCEVAEALGDMHRCGFVHRDVKPTNVLVDASGRAILIDLGLARPFTSDCGTRLGEAPGTAGYRAPEASDAASVGASAWLDPRQDVFALGVMGEELMDGHRLGRRVLARACSVEVSRRYRDGAAFASTLARAGTRRGRLVVGLTAAMIGVMAMGGAGWSVGWPNGWGAPLSVDVRGTSAGQAREIAGVIGRVLERAGGEAGASGVALASSLDEVSEPGLRGELRLLASEMLQRGDLPARAVEQARRGYELLGASGGAVFEAGLGLAAALRAAGQNADAWRVLQELVAVDADRAQSARRQAAMGSVLADLGDPVGAVELVEAAFVLLGTTGRHGERDEVLMHAGHVFEAAGACDRAIAAYEAALVLRRTRHGSEHRRVAETAARLGAVHALCGDAERSRLLLEESLAIRERATPGERTRIGQSLVALGAWYLERGLAAEAAELFARAYEAYSESLGIDHPYAVSVLVSLASAEVRAGTADALQRAVNARDRAMRVLGNDHWQTANARRFVAMGLSRADRNDEAGSELRRAISSLRATGGHAEVLRRAEAELAALMGGRVTSGEQ